MPSLDVLLLWAHRTGTSCLSHSESRRLFPNIIWSVTDAYENLSICQWNTEPGRERLWFKWRYMNVWLR